VSYLAYGNWIARPYNNIYFKEHQEIIKAILDRATVTIATTTEDPTQIIGYIVSDSECVHYVYLKDVFRGFGIAKKLLLTTSSRFYSQHTKQSNKVNSCLSYNPYLFRK
jgi:hypothetical protein